MFQNVRKIIIFRDDGIGDALNSTPAIAALRNVYRDVHISVVLRPPGAEILRLNPHIDGVLVYDTENLHRSLKAKLRFFRRLHEEQYNLAVILHNSFQSNLMAYISKARYRIGYKYGRRMFGFTLTHRVCSRYPKGTKHEIDRSMDVVRLAGAEDGNRELILCLSEEERAYAQDFLEHRTQNAVPIVGVHPGGSTDDKLWPAENFACIANQLMKEFDAKIILFGGPGEDALMQKIQGLMERPPISAQGLTLRQFAALVEKCSLFLCNDSGPMHIAAALKVPTVAIFGPTDHVRWKPRNNAVIVRKDVDCWPCSAHKCKREFECIKSLPVSDVWDAIVKQAGKQVCKNPLKFPPLAKGGFDR